MPDAKTQTEEKVECKWSSNPSYCDTHQRMLYGCFSELRERFLKLTENRVTVADVTWTSEAVFEFTVAAFAESLINNWKIELKVYQYAYETLKKQTGVDSFFIQGRIAMLEQVMQEMGSIKAKYVVSLEKMGKEQKKKEKEKEKHNAPKVDVVSTSPLGEDREKQPEAMDGSSVRVHPIPSDGQEFSEPPSGAPSSGQVGSTPSRGADIRKLPGGDEQ